MKRMFVVLSAAVMTFDNRADVVGRDGGRLYWYPGEGAGKFSARIFIGEGWATFPRLAGGDGDGDLWGVSTGGELFFWEGNGNGTFASGREVGAGWSGFSGLNVLDVNGDARADIVAVRSSDSTLWRWSGLGTGSLATAVQVGTGWSGFRTASY